MFRGAVCAANSQVYRDQGELPTPRAALRCTPTQRRGRPSSATPRGHLASHLLTSHYECKVKDQAKYFKHNTYLLNTTPKPFVRLIYFKTECANLREKFED